MESISPPSGTVLQAGDTITIKLAFHCPENHIGGHLIGAYLHDSQGHYQLIGIKILDTESLVTLTTQFTSSSMVSPYSPEIYLSCYKSTNNYTRSITRWLDNYYR
jgi:hypothetical protein